MDVNIYGKPNFISFKKKNKKTTENFSVWNEILSQYGGSTESHSRKSPLNPPM